MKGNSILNAKEIEFNIKNDEITCVTNNNVIILLNSIENKYIIAIIEELK